MTGAYLDGGGFDKTTASDIIHDLFIRPKGLQKSATRLGEGPLLTYLLQVIHNDIVILISSWGEGKNNAQTQAQDTKRCYTCR